MRTMSSARASAPATAQRPRSSFRFPDTHLTIALAAILAATNAHGQDRPAVFQHGLASSGAAWQEAAGRLQARVAIQPHVTTTDWRKSFDEQAHQLQSQLPALGMPPVAIGHSNGGLVGRAWSKSRALEGLVTIGTPHHGAPILLNGPWLGRYYASVAPRIRNLSLAFASAFDGSSWVGAAVWPMAMFAGDASATAVRLINEIVPVISQMTPGSSFLAELNSAGNLGREAAQIPHRVGIVAWDPNHYKGGPFRLMSPDTGERVHDSMQASTIGLLFYGSWLLGNAIFDPYDPDTFFRALERAAAIQDLASWLIDFNPTWCLAISSVASPRCAASDALIPFDSQYYPGADPLPFSGGPMHRAQTSTSDGKLYEALTDKLQIPARSGN